MHYRLGNYKNRKIDSRYQSNTVSRLAITLVITIAITLVVLSIHCVFASTGTTNGYVFSNEWGTQVLNSPTGIALDSTENVYITDKLDRVQKFSLTGTNLASWGNSGSGDGQFDNPIGVAIDAGGNVYIVDSSNHRIQKFDANGGFITKWGSRGSDYRQFTSPTGLAVDSKGDVYVTDTGNNRVQKFTPNGVFINAWGSEGKGFGQFDAPRGMAIDSNDNVYVVDSWNKRVQKFTSGGQYVTSWGDFLFPEWLTVDKDNNVYVEDSNQINKFDSNGVFLTKWGNSGSGEGQFSYPTGLAVNTSGEVFVLDSGNNRIEIFLPVDSSVSPFASNGTTEPPLDNYLTAIMAIAIVIGIVIAIGLIIKYLYDRNNPNDPLDPSRVLLTMPTGYSAYCVFVPLLDRPFEQDIIKLLEEWNKKGGKKVNATTLNPKVDPYLELMQAIRHIKETRSLKRPFLMFSPDNEIKVNTFKVILDDPNFMKDIDQLKTVLLQLLDLILMKEFRDAAKEAQQLSGRGKSDLKKLLSEKLGELAKSIKINISIIGR